MHFLLFSESAPRYLIFLPLPIASSTKQRRTMEENDERTSLVRSDSAMNRVNSPSYINNNGYNTGNGRHHNHNNNQAHPSREDPARRAPRTFFVEVQRSLALFQTWAAKILHENEESPIVNWVQNARVARTFMMVINVILTVSSLLCTLCTNSGFPTLIIWFALF